MKAKIYVGAKKYALYIGRKIVQKTLEFLTLPARFVSKKVQELKNLTMWGESKQSLLPDGYTQLEYIESTGTQYIKTNTKYTGNHDTVEWEAIDNSTDFATTLFACTGAPPYSGGLYGSKNSRSLYIGTSGGIALGYVSNDNLAHKWSLTIDGSQGSLKKDGVQVGSTSTIQGTINTEYEIYLFCGGIVHPSSTGITQQSKMRLYNWKLTDNGVVTANLIPAKRNSDNVIGMYDTISNTFLTNAGTGSFIAGNVATPTPTAPIEIESVGDRTVNVIDSNNKGLNARVIDSTTGSTASWGSAWTYIDYSEIKPNTEYTFYSKNLADLGLAKNRGYAFYDETKKFISGGYKSSTNIVNFTTPNNAKYFRVSVATTGTYMVVEGTYTVSNTPSYEPYGYKVPVLVGGKNLLGGEYFADTILAKIPKSTKNTTNKTIKYSARYSNDILLFDTFKENTIYTVVIKNITGLTNLKIIYSDDSIENINLSQSVFVTNANKSVKSLSGAWLSGDTVIEYDTFGIFEGVLTQDDFTPYVEPTTTNIYLNEPLRKIGEYADTLSVDGTEVTVTRNVGVIDDTGTKTIEESLIHKIPSTTETYTIENPIQLEQGAVILNVDTITPPSKINITGDIDNE